jgi:hypothetical protein
MTLHKWMALVHHYAHDVKPIKASTANFLADRKFINLWVRSWRRLDAPLATESSRK